MEQLLMKHLIFVKSVLFFSNELPSGLLRNFRLLHCEAGKMNVLWVGQIKGLSYNRFCAIRGWQIWI